MPCWEGGKPSYLNLLACRSHSNLGLVLDNYLDNQSGETG